jgi:MYXO-CTERM domain-containing protein
LVALGVAAAPAWAGVHVTTNPVDITGFYTNGYYSGYSVNEQGGPAAAYLGGIYNNIPTTYGGPATAGAPFVTTTITPTYSQTVTITIPAAWHYAKFGGFTQWGDDIQQIQGSVITNLWFRYLNTGGTATFPSPGIITGTHIIKLYDNVTPGTFGGLTEPVTKGAFITSIVLPGMQGGTLGGGTFFGVSVWVTGLSIPLPSSNLWIKFVAPAGQPGFAFNTFWRSGGIPAIGYSANGVNYSYKYYVPPQNYYVPGPFFSDMYGNIATGFNVPAPAVMSLLGLGGLVTLRRRRARA